MLDENAIAFNAAGISDSFRLMQIQDHDGASRMDDLTEKHQGWVGVVASLVEAARVMEEIRAGRGRQAKWGRELPYLYDVWDSIGEVLWHQLGSTPVRSLVQQAVENAVAIDAAVSDAAQEE